MCDTGSAGKVLGTCVTPEVLEKAWVHVRHRKCWTIPGYICDTGSAGKVLGTFVTPVCLCDLVTIPIFEKQEQRRQLGV